MFKHNRFLEACVHMFLAKYNVSMTDFENNKLTEIFSIDLSKIIKTLDKCYKFALSDNE